MTQYAFTPKDFKAFNVEGLDERMEALNKCIRPQLHQLGDCFGEYFTSQTRETFYAHVAKHACRSVNPPIDTWVAFVPDKRDYRMLPHLQIDPFRDQLFITCGVMHEGKNKEERVKVFDKYSNALKQLPNDYQISLNHMRKDEQYIKDLSDTDLRQAINRVKNMKKGEFFIACALTPSDERLKSDETFLAFIKKTFDEFLKLYE